ncbi:ATP-binding protein [Actinomadura craniellae]|uniref:ATP-binding protein n=1 Tax=Actinomadura craniellae TaxID=2231787 RepID=A0A365H727_9ACTN|nr:ATP-binding protein [Actinomadura craniellae]RAY14887.1 ATP-binding protein [Actinomadura craniellae]
MLLSFRVANHRSFYGEQELLLLPAYDKTRPVTPVAGVYGANASGKSNLLDALGFMRRAVLESFAQWGPLGGVPRDRFALARSAEAEPSTFGVDLLLDGQRYVYGFGADDDRITEEWLYTYPHGRRRVLFERDGDDFHFGDTLRGPKSTIEEVTRPNSLFLSAAAQHNLEQAAPIFAWFETSLVIAHQLDPLERRRSALRQLARKDNAGRMIQLMNSADLGISGIEVESGRETINVLRSFLTQAEEAGELDTKRIIEMLQKLRLSDQQLHHPPSSRPDFFSRSVINIEAGRDVHLFDFGPASTLPTAGTPKINTIRNTPDGPVRIPLSEESRGTQTWFDFLGTTLDALDGGQVLLVDELDASLHPLLVREFVRLFQNDETNPHGAQLIFTTHDTSLLARQQGEEVLRRDEVWFAEKTPTGETRLFPLTDFKPRQGLNWERRYLGGSVGAIPFLDPADFSTALDERHAANG